MIVATDPRRAFVSYDDALPLSEGEAATFVAEVIVALVTYTWRWQVALDGRNWHDVNPSSK